MLSKTVLEYFGRTIPDMFQAEGKKDLLLKGLRDDPEFTVQWVHRHLAGWITDAAIETQQPIRLVNIRVPNEARQIVEHLKEILAKEIGSLPA